VSLSPDSSGGGRWPSTDSTRNCTSWTWKLCASSSVLTTSQVSVVPTVGAKSTRSMAIDLPLICMPLSSNPRVRTESDSRPAVARFVVESTSGTAGDGRRVSAARSWRTSNFASPPSKCALRKLLPRSGSMLRSTRRSPGCIVTTTSARSPGASRMWSSDALCGISPPPVATRSNRSPLSRRKSNTRMLEPLSSRSRTRSLETAAYGPTVPLTTMVRPEPEPR
jgi:hypothetical protein